ncbi:MAG: CocE/NonD family hydrolase [Longimicrobiales bacterium]|nr:CocE/NonD family hydrolase [Longimicrobiales bacterium]
MENLIHVERGHVVPMADGVKLVTDVYHPAGDGPWPTLVFRVRGSLSAGFITSVLMLNPMLAVERGYAVVIQQVRGRGLSEGEWNPFFNEGSDGADCVRWVLDQSWCDGRIGTYGTAYSAFAALQLVAQGFEEVKACTVLGTNANPYDNWIYTAECFELGWNVYWAYMMGIESIGRLECSDEERAQSRSDLSQAIINAPEVVRRLPIDQHPELLNGVSPCYEDWLEHSSYDEYWDSINILKKAPQISAPILSIVGWHDNFLKSHFDLYRQITSVGAEPGRSNHRMVVGPWEHVSYVSPFATSANGVREFGLEASSGVGLSGPLVLDWMDRWVKEEKTTVEVSGVRYWQMGENSWKEVDVWPPVGVETSWYLSSEGGDGAVRNKGELVLEAPGRQVADTFQYDPVDPTPTVGGKLLMPTIQSAGIHDQTAVEQRSDVACYTSPVLTGPVAVSGPVKCLLWVSTSAQDTDFTAKLVDIEPGGMAANLADGIVRLSKAFPGQVNEPGAIREVEIDLWDLGHTFLPGHQIRLEVASANFPRFDRSLNVVAGPDLPSIDDAVTATQTIHHDADRPSRLILSAPTGARPPAA